MNNRHFPDVGACQNNCGKGVKSTFDPCLVLCSMKSFQSYDFLKNSSGVIPDSFKMARNVPSGISQFRGQVYD